MQAHVITFLFVDHDEVGAKETARSIEDARYPNRSLYPQQVSSRTIELGEWDDSHPTNQRGTDLQAWIEEAERKPLPEDGSLPAYDDVPLGYRFETPDRFHSPGKYVYEVRGRVEGLLVCRFFVKSKRYWKYEVIPPEAWSVTGWAAPASQKEK